MKYKHELHKKPSMTRMQNLAFKFSKILHGLQNVVNEAAVFLWQQCTESHVRTSDIRKIFPLLQPGPLLNRGGKGREGIVGRDGQGGREGRKRMVPSF
jgi:hypothetical protein